MSRIVIFANGELADAAVADALLQPDDTVVCADGGTRQAMTLGVTPDIVIGDLDSLSEAEHQALLVSGARLEQHPRDKDETDLELAIRYALAQAPSSILIIAALGRRLDQTIGNIALLADPELAGIDVRLDDGLEEVLFCRGEVQLQGKPGDLVSLIPWGAAVNGVRTGGLRWALNSETLHPDKTRGISNEMRETSARITISDGLLLVIHRRQS